VAQTGNLYSPIVLLLPAGARSLATGNVGVASRDDDVLFFNPAQLAIARGFSASGERYSPTASGGSMSAVTRFNNGGIGIGVQMVDYDLPIGLFPADRGTMLGPGQPATSLEASVGVAQVVKGVRVGGAAKYVEDNDGTTRVSRAAFDVGLSKDVFRFYTVALAVQNMGASTTIPCSTATHCIPASGLPGSVPLEFTSANLPIRTTLGVAGGRGVGEFDLAGTAAVSLLRTNFVVPAGGAEIGYSWLDGYSLALRAGARRPLPGERALTAGAGFTMDRLSIDYALEALSGSRIGHRLGLRVR
jgi:hypothetical protein